MSGNDRTSRNGQGWSDKDNAPLIPDRTALASRSFTDRNEGKFAKDLSAKSRMAGPGRAQPRKWMRIDEAGSLSYIAVRSP